MRTNYILVLLFTIILIDNIAASIILPADMHLFLKSYTLDGGYTIDKTIFASAIILLLSPAYIMASPLFGWLSDNIGRKTPLLACLSMSLVSYILLLIANFKNSLILSMFSFLLCNAASSSMTMVQAAIADVSQNTKRAYMLGLIVAVMLPIFLLVAQFATEISSTPLACNIMIMTAIFLTLFNILAVVFKLPESCKNMAMPESESEDIFQTIKRFFSNKPVLKLILLLAIIQFSCGLYFAWDTQYLTHLLGSSQIQMINYTEYTAMLLGIVLLYPLLLKYFSIPNILLGALVICFIGVLGCQIKFNIFYHWLFLTLMATSQCIAIATVWWLLLEMIAPQDWGLGMGIKGSAWALSWIFSTLIENSLTDKVTSLASFYIAGGVLLVGIALACSLLKGNLFSIARTSKSI